MERVVTVYTEASPNPNSLKFVLNFNLLENTSIDYPSITDAGNCPLVKELFSTFDFVERVFLAANFITITKSEAADWYEVSPAIREHIKNYLQEEKPLFTEAIKSSIEESPQHPQEADSDTVVKIKSLLDDYVRPAVEQDGGAISFHSYNEGVVKVLLQGSCSGCPSSTLTLKSGIENLLKRMMPDEINEVIAEGV